MSMNMIRRMNRYALMQRPYERGMWWRVLIARIALLTLLAVTITVTIYAAGAITTLAFREAIR